MKKSIFTHLLTLPLILFFLASCADREKATQNYKPPIEFYDAKIADLPETVSYAKKRGFGDFNGDGVEDMLEIRDEEFWGQDYKVCVFLGYYKDSILHFGSDYIKMDLPITMKWFSDATKLDVGDVNGDGFSDVIFTQYTELWGKDQMDIAFAINQNGQSFVPQTKDIEFKKEMSLADVIIAFVDSYDSVDDLYAYLKMDWGDVDGNGSDDLLLGWDGVHDLYLEVIFTQPTGGLYAEFVDMAEYEIPAFMTARSIRQLDIEDFDGDGRQDIFLHRTTGGNNHISIAINKGDFFEPHQDFVAADVNLDFWAFEKYDTFDVNRDGKADFVHVGEDGHKKVMAYNTVK